LRFETSRLGFLARLDGQEFINNALTLADGIALSPTGLLGSAEAATACGKAGKSLWLFAREVDDLLNAARSALAHTPDVVLALEGTHVSHLLHQARYAVAHPW
jgi:hypothetical protein